MRKMGKKFVLKKYPEAYAFRDIDGFWWILGRNFGGALNDARRPTKSAAHAWKSAAQKMKANAALSGGGEND
jgi:hypothetical protein